MSFIFFVCGDVRVIKITVGWINCLGHRIPHFRVTAYTLPFGIFVDGLLGLDLLMKIGAVIHTAEGMIEVF